MTSCRYGASMWSSSPGRGAAERDSAEVDPADRHLVEHGLDELRLDLDGGPCARARSYRSTGPMIAARPAARSSRSRRR